MCRLHTAIRTIKLSATKTFQWSPKTEIPAIKLWRYDSLTTLLAGGASMQTAAINGERNGKQNAQRHRSQRRTREADHVPRTDAAVDDGGSKGKRRTIGSLSRRRPFHHQVRGERSLGIPSDRRRADSHSRRHCDPGNRARGRAAIFRAPCWNDRRHSPTGVAPLSFTGGRDADDRDALP